MQNNAQDNPTEFRTICFAGQKFVVRVDLPVFGGAITDPEMGGVMVPNQGDPASDTWFGTVSSFITAGQNTGHLNKKLQQRPGLEQAEAAIPEPASEGMKAGLEEAAQPGRAHRASRRLLRRLAHIVRFRLGMRTLSRRNKKQEQTLTMQAQPTRHDLSQPASSDPNGIKPRPARLVCTERQWAAFRNHLIQSDGLEHAAFALLGRSDTGDAIKYYMHRLLLVPDDRCVQQHAAFVEPEIDFILECFQKYIQSGAAAILHAHSHPFTPRATFSGTDDYYLPGEIDSLASVVAMMASDVPRRFARIVLGQSEDGFTAEVYSEDHIIRERIVAVDVIGKSGIRTIVCQGRHPAPGLADATDALTEADRQRLDRNLNWLGEVGQKKIAETHIALCGLGGLGAEVMKNCRGLGIKRYTLIDMDRIEITNMNRLPYPATSVGQYKVDEARKFLLEVIPDAEVIALRCPVEDPAAQEALLKADLIVNSLDDDGARFSTQILAARHLIPLLDLGSGIALKAGHREVTAMGGQAIFYAPGEACLVCQGLDPARIVSREFRKFYRQIGYVQGTDETPTSVVTINSVMGGVAGDIIMKYLTGFSSIPSWVACDLLQHETQTLSFVRRDDCPICGEHGIEGLGTDMTKPIESPGQPSRPFSMPFVEESSQDPVQTPETSVTPEIPPAAETSVTPEIPPAAEEVQSAEQPD